MLFHETPGCAASLCRDSQCFFHPKWIVRIWPPMFSQGLGGVATTNVATAFVGPFCWLLNPRFSHISWENLHPSKCCKHFGLCTWVNEIYDIACASLDAPSKETCAHELPCVPYTCRCAKKYHPMFAEKLSHPLSKSDSHGTATT